MAEGAIATHEILLAYVDAGFTRAEAMVLVNSIVVEMVRRGGRRE